MPRAVGLDIGRTSVRVASVEVSSKRTRILDFVVAELEHSLAEEDHRRELARTIDRLFREHKLDRSSVICSLDADSCTLRDITVPFKSPDQIDKIIRFEAEHHLVATSIDDVVVDYMKVGEVGEKSRLLMVAARKDRIRERLGLLEGIGIDPLELDLDAVAIFNAVAQSPLASERENYVILDLGAQVARFLVVEERGLSHIRVSRLTAESGEGEDEADDRSRQAYLDRLIKVFRQFLMSVRLRSQPEVILLTGEGMRIPGLASTLESEFEVPAQALGLAKAFEHGLDPDLAEQLDVGAAAIGLAIKGAGVDRSGMAFRKDDLSYQRRFEQIRLHLVSLSMLAFLLAFVPAAYFYRLKTERQRQYDVEFTRGEIWQDPEVRDRGILPEFQRLIEHPNLAKATGNTREELAADLNKLAATMPGNRLTRVAAMLDNYAAGIDDRLGQSSKVAPIESSLLVLGDVFRLLKEAYDANPALASAHMRIYEIDVTPQQFSMKFWAPGVPEAELIRQKLELLQKSYFYDDKVKGVRFSGVEQKTEDGGVVRTIKADRISEEERMARQEGN